MEESYDEFSRPSGNERPEVEREQTCTEAIELTPNGQTVALNIPVGQWHTIRSLESGSVIMEMKDGRSEPIQDVDILQM